ncbi:MAG: phage tail tape measure protein, partial [Synergistaceae bacterium]|nr:phage tail tape measure protein [Synergistaceae bacterium]
MTIADENGNIITPDQLKKMKDKMQKLGVKLVDATGEALTPQGILMELGNRLKGMDNSSRVAVLKDVFGKIGFKAAAAMIDATEGEYQNFVAKYSGATKAAQEMSDITSNTGVGAMQKLTSATEALRIALGDQLEGAYDWVILKTAGFKAGIAQLIRQFPTLTKIVVGFITALLGIIGITLILTGFMAVIAGSVKIWGAAKTAMGIFFSGLQASVISSLSMIWSMTTPILAVIALVYGLKKAWDANLFGIRDVFDAISVGFGLAANANAEGLTELDAATHDRLKKNGSLDSALDMAMTFYRFKHFGEGFKEGFLSVFEWLGKIADKVGNFFGGMTEGSQALLNVLKIFKPMGESSIDSWKETGEAIGVIVAFFLGLALAVKAAAVAITLFNWACNPLFVILATLTAIIAKWETIELLWKDPAKLSITNPGELNYEQYKTQLTKAGAVIDENDKLVTLPRNIASIANALAQQAAIAEAEGNLKRLREQGAAMQAGWKVEPNQSQAPGWSREMENVYKDLGISTDTTSLTNFTNQLKDNFQGWNKTQNFNLGSLDEIKNSSLFTEDLGNFLKQAPQAPEQVKAPAIEQAPQSPQVQIQEQVQARQPEAPRIQEQVKAQQPEVPAVQVQAEIKQPEAPRIQEQVKAPEIQPENRAYQQYRDRLVDQGYLLDKNDHILQFPVDYGMDFDYAARQNIEDELARLKSAVVQAPKQPEPQIPQISQIQQEPQTVQQSLQPPVNALQGGQSASTIIKHDQNAASINGAANAQAAAQNPVNVNVNNEIQTKIETSSSDVRINEDVIGNIVHRHMESHQLRQGIDYGGMGSVSYGGAI